MNDYYYSEKPASPISEKEFTASCSNKTLILKSVSGVFSFTDHLDKATRLLIESFKPSADTVLDVGCGYGAIGLFLKRLYPQLQITMADINERAVAYTLKNAERNNLQVNVIKSDLYEGVSGITYGDIVTNPPIAAGKKVVAQLIEEARVHLNPGGAFWLTAFHNKGGATFKKIMEEVFGNAADMEKRGGIRVYRSENTGT